MMCGVQLADDGSTKKLMVRLGLNETIVEVVRKRSLRWLGHVVRKADNDFASMPQVKHLNNLLKQAFNNNNVSFHTHADPKLVNASFQKNNINKLHKKVFIKKIAAAIYTIHTLGKHESANATRMSQHKKDVESKKSDKKMSGLSKMPEIALQDPTTIKNFF